MPDTITDPDLDETPEAPEEPLEDAQEPEDTPEPPEPTDEAPEAPEEPEQEPETFSRDYVEKLRRENARYRERAGQADDLAHRLHVALVRATGRLADPEDLDFDEAHLDDEDALKAALDALLARKPHLASRRPRGDVGQGASEGGSATVDLAGLLRSRAS